MPGSVLRTTRRVDTASTTPTQGRLLCTQRFDALRSGWPTAFPRGKGTVLQPGLSPHRNTGSILRRNSSINPT